MRQQRQDASKSIDDLAGLSRTQPGLALALGIFMFSHGRHPADSPASSRKLYVFLAAIDAQL